MKQNSPKFVPMSAVWAVACHKDLVRVRSRDGFVKLSPGNSKAKGGNPGISKETHDYLPSVIKG